MRRTASEVLRNLEMRVARLERQASTIPDCIKNWDDPKHYDHPAMEAVRGLKGRSVQGYTLKEGFTGASYWSNGEDEIYITYDGRATTFYFSREDEDGNISIVGSVNIGRGGNDPVESDFLKASKSVLGKL